MTTPSNTPAWRSIPSWAAMLLVAAACGSDVTTPEPLLPTQPLPRILNTVLVSSPVPAPPDLAAILGSTLVYVSAPPGTFPNGRGAHLRYRGVWTDVGLRNGGWDPVPIVARAGDTLLLTVREWHDQADYALLVPSAGQPRVVRTDPPLGKLDTQLGATPVVVFSAPMDPARIGATTIELRRDGTPVAASVRLRLSEPWAAELVPAEPLEPATEYQLHVSTEARDVAGTPLAERVVVGFRTITIPPPEARIAFEREGRIMVVGVDGGDPIWLTDGSGPAWSPDGTRLAFRRSSCVETIPPFGPCHDLWTLSLDGHRLSQVTDYDWNLDWDPAWSPDGSRLAFVRFWHGPDQGYLTVIEGAAVRSQPSPRDVVLSVWWPVETGRPAWSPDGSRIAFTCLPHLPPLEPWSGTRLCVVPSDNGGRGYMWHDSPGLMHLGGYHARDPAWSPDGKRIAFSLDSGAADGHPSFIALIDPDGSGFVRLAPGRYPAWSPDGTRIVFAGPGGLHVMDRDGGNLIRITSDEHDTAPSWRR